MTLELKLAEAEKQIERNHQTNEFVEPKLEPVIEYIFDNSSSVTQEDMLRVKELFRRIAAMNKSTPFGCSFYNRLEQCSFTFAQEVLKEAIDTEPYYNCNDAALKSYIAVALRNTDVPKDITDNLFKHVPKGHLYEYTDTLRAVSESKPCEKIEIPDELKNTLLHAASHDSFEQTRGKALCVLVYFNIKEAIPTLRDRMQKYLQKINELDFFLLSEITTTATALEHLTEDKRYRDLVEHAKPEMRLLRKTPYSQEFIHKLNTKLKSVLNDFL